MNDTQIARINELARKSRTEGLTPEEAAEQKQLRQAYVASVRRSLESHLDNTWFQEADGSQTKLRKKE